MEMELYNTTDKTKVIPKFNYEGKMTMGPHESKKIEDYMAPFFKPYARVGIVARPIVRMGEFKLNKNEVEPEVEEVVKEAKAEKVEDKPVEVIPEEPKEEVKKEEAPVVEEIQEEPAEEKKEVKKYDKDKLASMSVKNLRVLADSMGVDVNALTKKADIVKAILDSQE